MKSILKTLICASLLMPIFASAQLETGDDAPAFELTGSDGKTYKLADLKGTAVVLAWFPKAFTGGCTKECKSLRENGENLAKYEVAHFTASCDTVEKNTAFAKDLELNYPILSDPGKEVAKAYGVVSATRPFPQRWTFYIDAEGKIAYIDKKVKVGDHGADIVAKLEELGVKTKEG